jgi:hypothetical protein
MSADWNTKYGTRRVRHDPPTLDEANGRITATRVIAGEQGAQRSVVVERRVVRRFGNDKRTGT